MESTRIHDLLERLGNLLRAEARRGPAAGLAPVQLQALAYLARANRYSDSPAALAEFLEITRGTASQTVGALRRKGLIEDRRDPVDRRRVHLAPTPAGRALAERAVPPALFARSLSDAEGAGALETALAELLRSLQRAHGGRSFGVCRTCRHFTELAPTAWRCGLTGERLSLDDSARICREHEDPSEA